MQRMPVSEKTADAAAVTSWGIWFISHVTSINEILQTFILLIGIATGGFALYWHIDKFRKS